MTTSPTGTLPKSGNRNYGIDLLRMLCMLMIAVLHTMGHGGVLNAAKGDADAFRAAWLLEIACYGAVNCYAIISGFVGVNSKFKLTNLLKLWLQVAFYSVVLTVAVGIFSPGTVNATTVFRSFFPVFQKQYWYFSAYFGMFLLTPVLNAAIHSVPRRLMRLLLLLVFLFYSLVPILLSTWDWGWSVPDVFRIDRGYSVLWLALLYLLGAYFSKYRSFQNLPRWGALLIYVGGVLITYADKIYGESGVWVNYHAPGVLIGSVALFFVFSGLKLNRAEPLIKFAAPLAFGVYLIHDHQLVRKAVMAKRFVHFTNFHPLAMLGAVLLTALCIYLVCTLIEWGRSLLFRVLRVDRGMRCLEEKLQKHLTEESAD